MKEVQWRESCAFLLFYIDIFVMYECMYVCVKNEKESKKIDRAWDVGLAFLPQ